MEPVAYAEKQSPAEVIGCNTTILKPPQMATFGPKVAIFFGLETNILGLIKIYMVLNVTI